MAAREPQRCRCGTPYQSAVVEPAYGVSGAHAVTVNLCPECDLRPSTPPKPKGKK